MARPVSRFVFWAAAAFGVLVAVASTTAHAWRSPTAPSVPDLLLSGLILIGRVRGGDRRGRTVAIGGADLGFSSPRLERAVRWSILGTSGVLSLSQLGVNTNVLTSHCSSSSVGPASRSFS